MGSEGGGPDCAAIQTRGVFTPSSLKYWSTTSP
jgi:hypothetical protein